MLISLRPSKKQGILVLLFRLLFFTSKLSEEKAAQDANSQKRYPIFTRDKEKKKMLLN